MAKYSKYRLSVASFLVFALTFSSTYFFHTYGAFLADSLEAVGDGAPAEQQMNVVTDMQITPAESPVVGDPVYGDAADVTLSNENLLPVEAVDSGGQSGEGGGGGGVDVGIKPIDPVVVENPQIPENCKLMIAGVAGVAPESSGSGGGGQSVDSATSSVGNGGNGDSGQVVPVEAGDQVPSESLPEGSSFEETAPVEAVPVEAAPVEVAPVEAAPVEAAPVESAPVESAPDPGVSADMTEVDVQTMSTAASPEDCQKYLDVVKQNVPILEVIPDVVEEKIVDREFSLVAMNTEVQMRELKGERQNKLKEMILDYYFDDHAEDDDYRFLSNNVFFLRLKIDDIYAAQAAAAGDEFVLLDQHDEFVEGKGLYYVYLVFSHDLDYDSLQPDNFAIESLDGVKIVPKKVFAYRKEAILLYESKDAPDASLLKLDGILNLKHITDPSAAADLSGYFSLQTEDDNYIEVASDAKTQYEAYIGDDITFAASKMSFGDFNQYSPGDSTLAIDIGNAASLNSECAILVFGNDLVRDGGSEKIPAKGFTLVSKSSGGVPIDAQVITDFEAQKSKSFLGFVYFYDLEMVNNAYALYLKLSVPPGLAKGGYRSDFSFEVFCPDGGVAISK